MSEQFQEIEVIDFKKKPKKVAEKKTTPAPSPAANVQQADLPPPPLVIDHEQRYLALLKRVTKTLNENNPDLAEKHKIVLKPPQVIRVGRRRTAITNFTSICRQLDRHPEHVIQFFLKNLSTSGSLKNTGFTFKDVLQHKDVESLLRKYIMEYVQCSICKSQHTELIKDEKMRLWTLQCKTCKSSKTVNNLKGAGKKWEDFEKEQEAMYGQP